MPLLCLRSRPPQIIRECLFIFRVKCCPDERGVLTIQVETTRQPGQRQQPHLLSNPSVACLDSFFEISEAMFGASSEHIEVPSGTRRRETKIRERRPCRFQHASRFVTTPLLYHFVTHASAVTVWLQLKRSLVLSPAGLGQPDGYRFLFCKPWTG